MTCLGRIHQHQTIVLHVHFPNIPSPVSLLDILFTWVEYAEPLDLLDLWCREFLSRPFALLPSLHLVDGSCSSGGAVAKAPDHSSVTEAPAIRLFYLFYHL